MVFTKGYTLPLPPYLYYALVRCDATDKKQARDFLLHGVAMGKELGEQKSVRENYLHIQLVGPVSAPMQRKEGRFRMQLLIQSKFRKILHHFLNNWLPLLENKATHGFQAKASTKWSIDIDPQGMS